MAQIIIDGYNLIRQSPSLSLKDARSLEAGRHALVDRLAQYKKLKGHAITVVFDAQFTDNVTIEEVRQAGIRILFSEQNQTADDVIIKLAEKGRDNLIIVTSDNKILNAAKSYGCAFLNVAEFEKKMNEALMFENAVGTGRDLSLPDTDRPLHKRWATLKKGPAKRLPKAKRRALARLNKI